MTEAIQAFNALTWPGAFALVGCAVAAAAVAVALVRLVCECLGNVAPYYRWIVTPSLDEYWIACLAAGAPCVFGSEHIPGDGAPFDAVAAARRLLAAAREGGAS